MHHLHKGVPQIDKFTGPGAHHESENEKVERGRRRRFGWIIKPFQPAELLKIVEKFIR